MNRRPTTPIEAEAQPAPEPVGTSAGSRIEDAQPIVVVAAPAETPRDDALSPEEEVRLAELETEIARCQEVIERGFLYLGHALREIRDRRLYRASHHTFEGYLKEKVREFSTRQRAMQIIAAAETTDHLRGQGLPVPERPAHVEPLVGESPEVQAQAWKRAHELKGEKKLKRKHVELALAEVKAGEAAALWSAWSEEAQRELIRLPEDHRVTVARSLQGEAVTPEAIREAGRACQTPQTVGGHERAPWSSWPREAQRVLDEVAEAERRAIHRAAEAVADGADVTPELVAEVIRSYRGLLREDGADRLPAVGGYPEGDEDDDGAPPERIVVEDLDTLDGQEGADAPTTPRRRGVPHVTNPAGERELSLYLPAVACPEALRAEGEPTRPVVAPLAAVEQHGGPVRGGVVNLPAIQEAAREAGLCPKFNDTNESVGWAPYTWNLLTGCLLLCVFCYAWDIAMRLWPHGFRPTLYPHRLDAPRNTPLPNDPADRRVFVCSMGDLFGRWVPGWFIQAVLDVIAEHPAWTFILLTKVPGRLPEFTYPPNAWVGVTVTRQDEVRAAAAALSRVEATVKWVSLEPLLGPVDVQPLLDAGVTFFALGGQSRTRRVRAQQPEWAWVEDVWWKVRRAGAKVFWKENLTIRPKEVPEPTAVEPDATETGAAAEQHEEGQAAPRTRERRPAPDRGPAQAEREHPHPGGETPEA